MVSSFPVSMIRVAFIRAVPIAMLVLAGLQDSLRMASTFLVMGAVVFSKLLSTFFVVGMPIELVIKSDSVRLVIRLHLSMSKPRPMRSFLVLSVSTAIIIAAVRTAAIISQSQLLQHYSRQGHGLAVAPMTTSSVKSQVIRPAPVESVAEVNAVTLIVSMAVISVALVCVSLVALFVILIVAVELMLLLFLALVAVVVAVAVAVVATVVVVANMLVVAAVVVMAALIGILLLPFVNPVHIELVAMVEILLLSFVGPMHVVLVAADVNIVSHVGSSVLAELILPLNVLIVARKVHGPAAIIVVEAARRHLVHVPWWWFPPSVEKLVHRYQVVVVEAIERPRVIVVVPCHNAPHDRHTKPASLSSRC